MNLLHLNVAADGTVEMLEAESFLRAGWVRVEAGKRVRSSGSNRFVGVPRFGKAPPDR
jgi:hypothetical protein